METPNGRSSSYGAGTPSSARSYTSASDPKATVEAMIAAKKEELQRARLSSSSIGK